MILKDELKMWEQLHNALMQIPAYHQSRYYIDYFNEVSNRVLETQDRIKHLPDCGCDYENLITCEKHFIED